MKRKYLHCIVALQVILLISLSACSKQKATERVLSKQRIAEHSYNLDYYGEFLQIYENEITHQTHANTEFCIDLKLLNIGNRRIQL